MTADTIPFSAWEQAVFVALFVVLVSTLLVWFSKQSDKWQQFMFDIDEKWRAFSKEQREQNNCKMENVENALNNLTTVTQALVAEVKEMRSDSKEFYEVFAAHDLQAKEIVNHIKKPTRSRSAKTKASEQS
jgi:ABC-type multidrug transport system fused ATPase/permease subunit